MFIEPTDAIFVWTAIVSYKGTVTLILKISDNDISFRLQFFCVLLFLLFFVVPVDSVAFSVANAEPVVRESSPFPLKLSPEEEAFVRRGVPLKMSEVDWEPLSIIDKKGKFRGIIADYMNMISEMSGLNFEFVPSDSWADVLRKYTEGELDVIPALSSEDMVGREVLFSDVYVSFPLVIVTGEKYGNVRDLSQFNGKRVAAGQSYTSYHYIEDNFPEIELVGTSDVEDGLLLLTKGQVDAFVGHLAVVVENMNLLGVENLKIAGTTRYKFDHRIGVSPEYPEALSIINKTLAAISKNSHREIRKKWFDVRYEQSVKYTEIVLLFAFMALALTAIIFWNRKLFRLNESLNTEVAQRRRMEKVHKRLYEIAMSVSRVSGIDEFYSIVQGQVNQLMHARNFYIAAYDRETDMISFPYFSDEKEEAPETRKMGIGLTDYVIKTGEPLFGDFETRMKLRDNGEYVLIGPECNIWLGVPLKLQGEVVGAMAVQSYCESEPLDKKDFEVLLFLSSYVGFALERLYLMEQGRNKNEALKEREIKYRSIFDNASDAILLMDLNYKFFSANPEAVSMFRCGSEEELLSYRPENLVAPNQREGESSSDLLDEWVGKTIDAGGLDFDLICRRSDGEEFYASVRARKMVISGTPFIQATLRDVTEKRRSKEEIERSVSLLTATIESSADGILAVDGYGQVVAWNSRFSSMWNITEHILRSGVVSDVFGYIADQLEEGSSVHGLWDYSLESEAGQIEELILVDGRIVEKYSNPQRIGSDIVGRVWSFRDVTRKRLSENELRDSYQRLNDIIEFLPDPTIVIDSNGVVLAWNKAVEEVTGVSKQDMIGKADYEYALPFYGERRPILIDSALKDDLEPLTDRYESLERRYGMLYGEVYTPRAFNGQGAYFWGVAGPLRDHSGKVVGAVECMRNVTERRRVEQELNRARLAAEAATRAKSEFLANMSHEIRTPMNSIIGFGHLMQSADLDSAQREYLNKMMSSADSLLSIIGDILDFSKIEAGKFVLEAVEFQLDHVLEKICNMVSVKAESKGIDFILSVGPDVPLFLRGDPLRLEQVLTNLVNNAVKFTDRGEVNLIVTCEENCTGEASIKFIVRDSGIGLSSEEVSVLFNSFTQADASTTRKYGGTGLGLAIARSLVELMGGTVSVESHPGEGSSFYFTVKMSAMDRGSSFVLPAGKAGMKSLVIEGNMMAREFIRSTMEKSGITVMVDSTASSALERLAESIDVDGLGLILVSGKIQDMHVLEVVERIRNMPKLMHVPIILMSPVNMDESFRKEAALVGVDGFVTRPVSRLSLYAALQGEFNDVQHMLIPDADVQDAVDLELTGQSPKILLVEDNELNQQVARRMLEGMGLDVDVADNGRKALEALESEPYSLVIMDIQMPEMDGLTASRIIRSDERYRNLPILAMTAHAMPGDREKSFEAGMNEHLTKPIDPEELKRALVKYLNAEDIVYVPSSCELSGNEQEMPDLPGIDCAKGLRNIGGNKESYLKVLQGFKDRYGDFQEELKAALADSGPEQALIKIHSLKGISGNIGAVKLYEFCRLLEGDLRDTDRSGYEDDLLLFVSELDLVIKGLQGLKVGGGGNVREYVYDKEKSFNLINKLYIMLGEGDAECGDVLAELRNHFNLERFEGQLAELTRYIENFDFEDGRFLLERIADELNIPLDKG
ncbi:multi-sensor hybrid histidine kinase [Maridesulfovibrio salexigens DSM 2638]|uniref:Sensory/regulatory protein RpfC n=2 Tax=Maridesulfovibrio salexigens TaxID=880 RepID=C6BRW9_MARSD|nr:multi-sensor hybrid histidine kinase [Maridesulfovibrio salexigens DSM 2638]